MRFCFVIILVILQNYHLLSQVSGTNSKVISSDLKLTPEGILSNQLLLVDSLIEIEKEWKCDSSVFISNTGKLDCKLIFRQRGRTQEQENCIVIPRCKISNEDDLLLLIN